MKDDLHKRIAHLSDKKRDLLEAVLAQKGKPKPLTGTISRRTTHESLPLSSAQERLWFLDQLEPGSPFYNIPIAVSIRGPLDVALLTRVFNDIARRHEVLRTTFAVVDGQTVQRIQSEQQIEVPTVDLRDLPDNERIAEAERVTLAEAREPFNLTQGPLMRVLLLRQAELEHTLIVTMHHIISDGWSAGILMREIITLYSAFHAGQPSPLAELPIQYADYAIWQRQWLQSERRQRHLDYWHERLHDLPVLNLPTSRVRPQTQTYRGAVELVRLTPATTAALRALSRQEGVTLFMTLLAAFAILLERYTDQDDLAIGTLVAGRSQADTKDLIGFFVNPLVLRVKLDGNPTVRTLLQRVRDITLGAYAHQELPFEQVVAHTQPDRDLSRQPLFQVMFSLQQAQLSAQQLHDLELEPVEIDTSATRYDLDLSFREGPDDLTAFVYYNTDLFDADAITRLLGHLTQIIDALIAAPQQSIAQIDCLTEADHQVILSARQTQQPYPAHSSLQHLFEAQAAATPDQLAVFTDQLSAGENSYAALTYAELNQAANRLAHRLRASGVGPEIPVGVFLDRSPRLLVALLAIIKAGGVYVPLDPGYPQSHLAFMLNDTNVPVVVTLQHLVSGLPTQQATLLCLDADERIEDADANPPHHTDPDNLLYIMYTSGSTGQPKGVAVAERQLLNRFAWMWRAYPFEPDEVAFQRTSINFSVSVWELLGPLLQGVPIFICPDTVMHDPVALVELMSRHAVTRLVVVPSLLNAILASNQQLSVSLRQLRLVSVCGEPLSRALVEQFYAQMPHITLLNQYGASELNDTACYNTRLEQHATLGIPIGRPIANLQVYLLDRCLRSVPVGVPGELYVGSVSLARGYLNRPDLTAERFIPNPFATTVEQQSSASSATESDTPIFASRLYRTGDLARFLADGTIEHMGRADYQVKIRGIRVELKHVETVIALHPHVRQTVVVTRQNEAIGLHLVAYVAPQHAQTITQDEVRLFLRERLPEHMIPAIIVVLDALPLTPNGKIDRKALPAPVRPRLTAELVERFLARVERLSADEVNNQLQYLRVKNKA